MKTLTPAYGRDYRSQEGAKDDLIIGVDFILNDFDSPWDGKPISIRDLQPGEMVKIRYGKLRKACFFTKS